MAATREGNGTVTSKKCTGWCMLHLRRTSDAEHRKLAGFNQAAACLARRYRGPEHLEGRTNGPYSYTADSQWRSRPLKIPRRDPQVPDAGTAGGVHARQALARA